MSAIAIYSRAAKEVFREQSSRALELIAKLILARVRYSIGPELFFSYELYDKPSATWPDYYAPDSSALPILKLINQGDPGRRITLDKVLTTQMLSEAGVRVAPISAVINRAGEFGSDQRENSWAILNDFEGVIGFLDSDQCPPELFSKPAGGVGGSGTIAASLHEGQWHTSDNILSTEELANLLLQNNSELGRLVQPQLKNHPALEKITGGKSPSTVRVVTAIHNGKARIVYAVQKLTTNNNTTDNFSHGDAGNMMCAVDIGSGTLENCYGKKSRNKYILSQFNRHPNTDERTTGAKIPLMDEVFNIAKDAALVMKEQPLLGFDIAITENGPIILEANNYCGFSAPQLTHSISGRALLVQMLQALDVPNHIRAEALKMINDKGGNFELD